MTFTEIVDEILDRLNLTSPEAETRVGRAVNRLYKAVTTSTGLNTTRTILGVSGTLADTTSEVTFSGVEKLHRVYDISSGTARDLKQLTIYQIRERKPVESSTPKYWAVQTTGATTVVIRVDIIAADTMTLYADGTTTVSTLSGSNVPVIPESFHDILVEGVLKDEYKKLEKNDLAKDSLTEYKQRLADLQQFLAKSAYIDMYSGVSATQEAGSGGGGGSSSAIDEFVLLDGRPGGQDIHGGTASGEDLTLTSTSHATKGDVQTSDRLVISRGVSNEVGLLVSQNTGVEATQPAIRATGYSPSIEVIDKDSVQNWYFGIDDNDSDALLIGPGYGPGQGLENLAIAYRKTTYELELRQGRLKFPAAQNASSDANTLDDYEEGTWSPTLSGTGGGSGQAYTVQFGRYVKIGTHVFIHGRLTMSTRGSITGVAIITSLPFSSASTNYEGSFNVGYWNGMTSSFVFLGLIIQPSTTQAQFWGASAAVTGLTGLVEGDLSNSTDVIFSGFYRAAA